MTTAVNKDQPIQSHRDGEQLPSPAYYRKALPLNPAAQAMIDGTRKTVHSVLLGHDPRLVVVVGPCSIHDPIAAHDYGEWLCSKQRELRDRLILIMRAYVEKPRTRFGWNGLVNDPTLDGAGKISDGLEIARKLLLDLHAIGVPTATEFVDVITSPYLQDVVSWVAIGARTAESPIHRQLASGLPCPVGFKNGTDGNVSIAVDGVAVARTCHKVAVVDDSGHAAVRHTGGNDATHVILRGGAKPNHDHVTVSETLRALENINLPARLMIDCSHGNANQPGGQVAAFEDVVRQIRDGASGIMGVMLESNLVGGCQQLADADNLIFGKSVTDPCLGLDETASLLDELATQVNR